MLRRAQRDNALGILVDLPIAHPLAPLEKQAREKGWYSLAAPLNTGEVGEPVDRRRTLFCATAQPLGKFSLRDLGFHGIVGAPARPFLLPTAEVPPSCWASEGRWGGGYPGERPPGGEGGHWATDSWAPLGRKGSADGVLPWSPPPSASPAGRTATSSGAHPGFQGPPPRGTRPPGFRGLGFTWGVPTSVARRGRTEPGSAQGRPTQPGPRTRRRRLPLGGPQHGPRVDARRRSSRP